MSVYETLRRDHRSIERLFDDLLGETDEPDRRWRLFEDLRAELLAHTEAEEQEFYPLLESHASTLVNKAYADHSAMRERLEDLEEIEPEDASFLKKVEELSEVFLGHVQMEEDEVFPVARRHLGDDVDNRLGRKVERAEEEERRVLEPEEA